VRSTLKKAFDTVGSMPQLNPKSLRSETQIAVKQYLPQQGQCDKLFGLGHKSSSKLLCLNKC
jgi:hypothetical protein